jgi:hypothetical protein
MTYQGGKGIIEPPVEAEILQLGQQLMVVKPNGIRRNVLLHTWAKQG